MTDSEFTSSAHTTTRWFRHAAPYIHAHRDATCVIAIDSATLTLAKSTALIQDLALLNSLGLRLVITFDAHLQVAAACDEQAITLSYHQHAPIIDDKALVIAQAAIGQLLFHLHAQFSFKLPDTPIAKSALRCSSGNFVTAKPLGIHQGVDLHHSGAVRKIDTAAIEQQLDLGNIVILPPLGYSSTGDIFYLSGDEVASACAQVLAADKLIFLTDPNPTLPREMTLAQAEDYLSDNITSAPTPLRLAIAACQNTVKRVHLLDRHQDNALIQELYSRDGAGTMISAHHYESTRRASIEDIAGILSLIQPLEEKGILVKRSRETIELSIEHYIVMERDGRVIGCAALHPYDNERIGELACLAVADDYQHQGRGEVLLQAIILQAKKQDLATLYSLTTQTSHWFIEQGFIASTIDELPIEKQSLYNYQRNATVLVRKLT